MRAYEFDLDGIFFPQWVTKIYAFHMFLDDKMMATIFTISQTHKHTNYTLATSEWLLLSAILFIVFSCRSAVFLFGLILAFKFGSCSFFFIHFLRSVVFSSFYFLWLSSINIIIVCWVECLVSENVAWMAASKGWLMLTMPTESQPNAQYLNEQTFFLCQMCVCVCVLAHMVQPYNI